MNAAVMSEDAVRVTGADTVSPGFPDASPMSISCAKAGHERTEHKNTRHNIERSDTERSDTERSGLTFIV
jgi:hypothetical protein